ncbi:polyhydroxyalkanoic acid system family protein [Pyxidicoccus parkwayensis]|jgi:Putative polyhydroxyalkanoic acid system protein (PHA_gran_rgn)|uniref:Polyhydroxyalkanoic acid system family protein n=1 Tax=Pyxidicoccus parkwayensis TaxID=2813578 RepID=A0ABX7P559_9BACT|nr:polyhydroxyalkanoic acid system family protein [Pyxidicoccus parkwaysis]QSQ25629.1 polyhydroxyalkanoic acid system family protein [Pyxidicoccus parkwaysis]
MGMMKFDIPHSLPKEEVKQRVEQLLKYWSGKYGVKTDWAGDGAKIAGKVMGIQMDASFVITDNQVQGEGTDPGMLLRSKAKSYLQEKFASVLDPKKTLDQVKSNLS